MREQILAALCLALPRMRAEAAQRDAAGVLEELVSQARGGADVAQTLLEFAAAWDIEVDVDSQSSRADVMPVLPGVFAARAFVQIYRCPGQACSRRWVRQPAIDPPECAIYGPRLSKPDPLS
ncbi:hypothetical protein GKC29_25380 [Micromonospora sp. WMMC415]|uniref:hypothetical protein n=1 Tax=Micromonospora sp. WMMC415 TaxID=2675222 RepID=UPI0012B4AACB|nr:hypothetical protein [Micromonospora sp. WMMC415]QGN49826.1 hypothetical protein GKC29_25380 [Micromonospora sp. WMMC415]